MRTVFLQAQGENSWKANSLQVLTHRVNSGLEEKLCVPTIFSRSTAFTHKHKKKIVKEKKNSSSDAQLKIIMASLKAQKPLKSAMWCAHYDRNASFCQISNKRSLWCERFFVVFVHRFLSSCSPFLYENLIFGKYESSLGRFWYWNSYI